ncbi:MAG TPA: hypothetical protein ENH10_01485 [Bacteroidetes bacterium]|nr:hypothetical protein [Bacteroidota bacterium]HEX03818.1 hypothetical protein [Bacteroidota bacterium]
MMIHQLSRIQDLEIARLIAYVVMPNHVHVIVTSCVPEVESILYALKKPVSQKALPYLKSHFPGVYEKLQVSTGRKATHRFWLWGGGHVRAIRSHEEIQNQIKYIHRNPVRNRLVERPEDWRWSSFRYYRTGDPDPILVNRPDWI